MGSVLALRTNPTATLAEEVSTPVFLWEYKMITMVSAESDRLVGLVVKASASRAEDPGFESRLRRDFFGVESYQ